MVLSRLNRSLPDHYTGFPNGPGFTTNNPLHFWLNLVNLGPINHSSQNRRENRTRHPGKTL